MHLLVLASGSGGHVYPCLSFIKYALQSHKVSYLKIKDGFENKIPDKIYESAIIDVPNQLKTYLKHPKSFFKLKKELNIIIPKLDDIDAIICFGGFVSFIGVLLSIKMHKPLYLHEQNIIIGDANRVAAFFAKKVFLSFNLKTNNSKFKYIGNPRMDECLLSSPIYTSTYNVLFFAGSLASSSLNDIVEKVLQKRFSEKINLTIISGDKFYQNLKKYETRNIHIIAYQKDMISLMKKMDLIIMRAGATSLSELIALEKVGIVIPSPNVKHHHQEKNAKYLANQNAIIMIKESDLTPERLFDEINNMSSDYFRQLTIKNNIRKFQKKEVCKTMLKEIEDA